MNKEGSEIDKNSVEKELIIMQTKRRRRKIISNNKKFLFSLFIKIWNFNIYVDVQQSTIMQ